MATRRRGRGLTPFILIIAAAGLLGYWALNARPVQAGDIRRDPRAYEGRVVTIRGKVVGGASLGGALMRAVGGGGGFFLLDDGTGQVGVLTEGMAPRPGEQVTVRGPVQVVASLSVPKSWAKVIGANTGEGALDLTAVVIRAERIDNR